MAQRYELPAVLARLPEVRKYTFVLDKDYVALEQKVKELEDENRRLKFISDADNRWKLEEDNAFLQADNILLRKRLEPIEALWDKGDDYVIANIDDVRTALLTCMDLKEGVK
jgi:hypothetical protein